MSELTKEDRARKGGEHTEKDWEEKGWKEKGWKGSFSSIIIRGCLLFPHTSIWLSVSSLPSSALPSSSIAFKTSLTESLEEAGCKYINRLKQLILQALKASQSPLASG